MKVALLTLLAGSLPTRRGCSWPCARCTGRPACRSPCTPTPPTRPGRLAIELYAKEGVDLTKVVIGHAGDTNDLDYLKWLMDQGATIGCDRFGIDVYNPTADRVATVAALCAQGYADRIVLSHDANCYIDYFSGEDWQAAKEQAVPNWHYEHIHRDVLPALREQGVTDEQIENDARGQPAPLLRELSGMATEPYPRGKTPFDTSGIERDATEARRWGRWLVPACADLHRPCRPTSAGASPTSRFRSASSCAPTPAAAAGGHGVAPPAARAMRQPE